MRKKANHFEGVSTGMAKQFAAAAEEVGSKPVIALTLQSMTIKREGQVEWIVEGDHHCGPKSELKTYPHTTTQYIPVKYTLSVTCAPHLDQRGFLFDQASVGKWMERISSEPTKLSCEALVVHVATQFLLKMAKDVPHCKVTELVLTLSPSPFQAGVTCRFA